MPPKTDHAHLMVVILYYGLTQMQKMLIVLRELTGFCSVTDKLMHISTEYV